MSDIEEAFNKVYSKFKMHFYNEVFGRSKNQGDGLTTVEFFCMEGISALDKPTVAEFAAFMNISTPNAAYKVNSLVEKGYLKRVQSKKDRREYHLLPTEKYNRAKSVSYSYLGKVVERAEEIFSGEDLEKLAGMLNTISERLMPEVKIKKP